MFWPFALVSVEMILVGMVLCVGVNSTGDQR